MVNNPTKIIWHHTAVASDSDQFVGINNSHKRRNFPKSSLGFFVGYHYVIEHSGKVRQARQETEIGAHDRGENVGSIGIALTGHFNFSYPSQAQKKAAKKLVSELMDRWGISADQIEPHRTNDATDCPGTLLPDNWIIPNPVSHKIRSAIKLLQEYLSSMSHN